MKFAQIKRSISLLLMLALCCILLVGCGESEGSSTDELLSKLMGTHKLGETRNQFSSRGNQVTVYGVSLEREGSSRLSMSHEEFKDDKLTKFVIGDIFETKESFTKARDLIIAGIEKDFKGILQTKGTVKTATDNYDLYEGYLDDGKIRICIELFENIKYPQYSDITITISE